MSEGTLKAVIARLAASSLVTGAPQDERHFCAWARFVFSMCNEHVESDAARTPPLAPPSVASCAVPEALITRRQACAHGAALDRIAAASATGDTAGRTEAHANTTARFRSDACILRFSGSSALPLEEEAFSVLTLADVDELDSLVRPPPRTINAAIGRIVCAPPTPPPTPPSKSQVCASLRQEEDRLQDKVSEILLRDLVGELAEEVGSHE